MVRNERMKLQASRASKSLLKFLGLLTDIADYWTPIQRDEHLGTKHSAQAVAD